MNADERGLEKGNGQYSAASLFSSVTLMIALAIVTLTAGLIYFELLRIIAAFCTVLIFGPRSGGGEPTSAVFNIPPWIPAIIWLTICVLLIYKEYRLKNATMLRIIINATAVASCLALFFTLLTWGILN